MSDEEYPCDPGYCQIVELHARIEKLEAQRNFAQRQVVAAEAKLATCEKYKAAYAECDRIGTQAVRDLEAKLAKAVDGLRKIESIGVVWSDKFERQIEQAKSIAHTTLAELKGEDRG
jgi:hypothetical protein